MKPDDFTSLLQNLTDALQRWADWLPGDRDGTQGAVDSKYEFHETVDDERLKVLARLGADGRDYLGELVDRALKRVLRAGQKFAAACDGLIPSGKEFWQDIALDDIPVSDAAYPDEFGHAVAWLLEALYRCNKVIVAIDTAVRQADFPDDDKGSPIEPRLSPMKKRIVETVRRAERRLTGDQIIEALSKSGKPPGTGTVYIYLAELTAMKVLTNSQQVDPPGYGLPEWD